MSVRTANGAIYVQVSLDEDGSDSKTIDEKQQLMRMPSVVLNEVP